MAKYRIQFIRDEVIRNAPKQPGKGGFEIEHILSGSERIVNEPSLAYWNARGAIKVLGRVAPETAEVPPLSFPKVQPVVEDTRDARLTKTAARASLTALVRVFADETGAVRPTIDGSELVKAAAVVAAQIENIKELAGDEVVDDTWTVLEAGLEDIPAKGMPVSVAEFRDVIFEVINILLPASRRRKMG